MKCGSKKIMVVGIGSRLMMDDGIGIYLVESLKHLETNLNIEYIIGENDVDYCMAEVLESDHIIIIDAFLSGKRAGEVTVVSLSHLSEENKDGCYSLHGMHFINVLKYTRQMPEGILIGIEPYEINYGLNLSNELQSCYPDILKLVRKQVNEYINGVEE